MTDRINPQKCPECGGGRYTWACICRPQWGGYIVKSPEVPKGESTAIYAKWDQLVDEGLVDRTDLEFGAFVRGWMAKRDLDNPS